MQREIWMLFEWIAPFFVTQMKMLITIQSHSSLIIPVMMQINYQLNSWSHRSVVDLLCIMGCYSLDGEVNTHLTVQRHAHTSLVWYSVLFFNRWSKYKSKCGLSHMQVCKERPTVTQGKINTDAAYKYIHLMVWCTEMCAAHQLFIYWIYYILICVIVYPGVCSCMIILSFTVQSTY